MKYVWNNEQSETRRTGKTNIHAEQSEAGNFFEKIKNKGPKIHCLALKLYTGASKSRGQGFFLLKSAKRCIRDSPYLGRGGGAMAPLAPPGSATGYSIFHNFVQMIGSSEG